MITPFSIKNKQMRYFILSLAIISAALFLDAATSPALAGKLECASVTTISTSGGSPDVWTPVSFRQTYDDVPLVFTIINERGNNSAASRVRNITTTGCDVCVIESDNWDGSHLDVSLHYVAIEPGAHILADGTRLYAFSHDTQTVQFGAGVAGTAGWDTLAYSGFTATPIILTQIQSLVNESRTPPSNSSRPFLTVAVQNAAATSVDVALERSEAALGTITADETIGLLVMEAGNGGTLTDNASAAITYESIHSPASIVGWDNSTYTVNFTQTFATPPLVVASKNTRNGNDGGWLRRYGNITTTGVGFRVDEDTYRDSERGHTSAESAGVLVFSSAFDAVAADFVPTLSASKSVTDENSGNLVAGDTLLYTVVIQNTSAGYVTGVRFTDAIASDTTYVAASASVPAGSAIVTETPTLDITGITIPPYGRTTVTFRVQLDNPLGAGVTEISNQGTVYYDSDGNATNDANFDTDGDTMVAGAQATTIPVATGPIFDQTIKTVEVFSELSPPFNGSIEAGETLRYTIRIINSGDTHAIGVTFTDLILANTTYVAGSVLATAGVATDAVPGQIGWAGDINAGTWVSLTFDVTVDALTPDGTKIANQGTVSYASAGSGTHDSTMLTDGEPGNPGRQTTNIMVGRFPRGLAVKNVIDENGGNLEAGDILRYTVTWKNLTTHAVNDIAFTDVIPNNTTYVAGSVSPPTNGTVVTESPVLYITGFDMPAQTQKILSFRVQVDNPLPAGINQIINQATGARDIDGDGILETQLTDGDTTQPGNQPTLIPISTGPNFDQTSQSVSLRNDKDGNGVVTPLDILRYNIKIRNTGDQNAVGVTLTDPFPPFTVYDFGSGVTATSGSVTDNSGLGPIEWTGDVNVGDLIVIEFNVEAGVVPLKTIVSTQGTVYYDSNGDLTNDSFILTDGDLATPGRQTTDVELGGFAHAYGLKTPTDLNGGFLEPGDILEYTIYIENTSGFDGNGVELWDPIPNGTEIYDFSTVSTYDYGTLTFNAGTNQLEWTGNILAHTDLTITFQVKLDNPMPVGITQLSNQAIAFYDSNSDGTNDTYQGTDGDTSSPGNQPTLSDVYVGMISGTVFDDLNEDTVFDAGEPGISGVTVELYNTAFVTLYGTYISDIDGYYEFTGRPSGDYGVRETNPTFYNNTTPDDVQPVTIDFAVVGGDTQTVNFGDHPNGYADLAVSKVCAPVFADGSNQIVFVITVSSSGPEDATNTVLTDDLTALAAAGLSNINYTLDGGSRNSWSGSYDFGTVAMGDSHTIRIFADVAEGFVPDENTATVISDIFDPTTGDNTASCTNLLSSVGRRAMEFESATNYSITVAAATVFDLGSTGTIEAWIYPTALIADAGIVMKGTITPCYGIGLGGGTAGDVFFEGTAENIGFVLYDNTGVKHLLTADTHTLPTHQWQHVACAWSGAAPGNINARIYINGILKASDTFAFANSVRTNTEDLIIGYQGITTGSYTGIVDDVRIWDAARLQDRIKDTLCHKITDSETDYADLMGYWRFDEESDSLCTDSSAFGNIGETYALRNCSTSPIGDASAHDYSGVGPGGVFQTELPFETLDKMTLTEENGSWSTGEDSCIHVYRVDTTPEYTSSPLFWRSFANAPRYWGAFVSGGTGPTYTAEYNYTGFPAINSETSLRLAFRDNNCEPWKGTNADLDTVNDLLTLTGLSGTEFILGQNIDPRNAIDFDSASSQYVQVGDGGVGTDLDPTTYGTVEAWINLSSTPQSNAGIVHKGNGTTSDAYSLYLNGSGGISFTVYDSGGGSSTISSTATLSTGIWYHVAAAWDDNANTLDFYLNGISDATTGTTVTARDSGDDLYIGVRQTSGPTYFDGIIDEVRVWTITRNQTNIRNTMCQKLTGNESGLGGYWRFDQETTSTTTPDYDFGTKNDGTMYGFGTSGAVLASRICSPAPIGDDSAYDYATATISANLVHSDGDDMTAAEFAGNWATTYTGIQVYRIDEAPVYPPDIATVPYAYGSIGLTPPPGWSSIDYYRYWGVFVTDWVTTPSYQVVYNYGGNPSVPVDESELGLAIRDQYCDRTWADTTAALDTGANTLTHTNETVIDEFILGGKANPLAIALASFYAEFDRENDCIRVTWKTATEVDTIGFQLWRSDTKEGPYTLISGSFTASQAVSETTGAQYSYSDCDADLDTYMTFYYKLEEIDLDTTKKNPVYGPIGPVTESVGASQLDRDSGSAKSSDGCFIDSLTLF